MAVGKSVGSNSSAGSTLGIASTELVSFWGATPVDQPTNASIVTATDAATAIVAVNGVIAALKECGILAS